MNTMKLATNLSGLKTAVLDGKLSIEEVQRNLSKLILLDCNSMGMEKMAKKIDNDLELVIYTLSPENQIEAAVKVIDEALEYVHNISE